MPTTPKTNKPSGCAVAAWALVAYMVGLAVLALLVLFAWNVGIVAVTGLAAVSYGQSLGLAVAVIILRSIFSDSKPSTQISNHFSKS